MKLTNKAKKKWFKDNVNSYEIYYYDKIRNARLVTYHFQGFLYKNFSSMFCSQEIVSFIRYIEDMKDWEIFFKFRKFLRYDLNKCGFRMSYSKYNKQLFD